MKYQRILISNKKSNFKTKQLVFGVLLVSLLISLGMQVALQFKLNWAKNFHETYVSAYKQYYLGDLQGAAINFKKALETAESKDELSQTYKMMGIIQYQMGNYPSSRVVFNHAKKLNPGLVILSSEVLDDTVIEFFESPMAAKIKIRSNKKIIAKKEGSYKLNHRKSNHKRAFSTNAIAVENSWKKYKRVKKTKKYKVNPSTLLVRSGPGKNFKVVDKLKKNHIVKVKSTSGEWVSIGQRKFISRHYISPSMY